MKRIIPLFQISFFFFFLVGDAQRKTIDQKVDSVLKLMTLDEKIGQMNQYNGDWEATGPITKVGDKQIRLGREWLAQC
jgi:beta-glucosidase